MFQLRLSYLCVVAAALATLRLSAFGAKGAECTGFVNSNLAVSGAYSLLNGTVFQINSNEYATFTCEGNASPGVPVESTLRVSCDGDSSPFALDSPPGVTSVQARWQSNDGCEFISRCEITCSAESACDKSREQFHELVKVQNYNTTMLNCSNTNLKNRNSSDTLSSLCTNSSFYVQSLTRQIPRGSGQLTVETTCGVTSEQNDNNITVTLVVFLPTQECSCETVFKYRERDSTGSICSVPVLEHVFLIENPNPIYCDKSIGVGMMILIVILVVSLIVLTVVICVKLSPRIDHHRTRSSQKQAKRMAKLDSAKISELIVLANQPNTEPDGRIKMVLSVEDSPIYDEIPDPIALEQDNMSGRS